MGSGIRYGRVEPKKKEKIEQTLNNDIINLIDDIVNEINIYSLSKRIRESLIVLFKEYDYLKTNNYKIEEIKKYNNEIFAHLLNEENIKTIIEIRFTLLDFNISDEPILLFDRRLDLLRKRKKLTSNNINIVIGESKIIPNDHKNMYYICLSIRDLNK